MILGLVATGHGLIAAAQVEKENKTSLLLNLNPVSIFSRMDEGERHILEGERVPGIQRQGREERHIHSIYFPPNPPPLGVDLSLHSVDPRVGGPPELAPFVMEIFYAPLSTRLVERSLTRKQQAALDAYVAKKAGVLEELRLRLAELANLGPELRLLALEELAVRQAPALAALEQEADALREAFYTQPLNSSAGSWYEWRGWKLGRGRLDLPREQTLFFEGQLLRAAAFYQSGPSLAQRRLLRECAIELEALVFPDERAGAPGINDWFWFFSPHLARVHLPEDLPRELTERVAHYRAAKAELKAELQDTIYELDRAVFSSARAPQLGQLAREHASRLDALEQEAELIRRGLVRSAPVPVPPLPRPLPPELVAMINAYSREKISLERELSESVRRAVRHLRAPASYEPGRSLLAWNAARLEAIDAARTRFMREQAERLTAARDQLDAIRVAVEDWAGPAASAGTSGKSGSFLTDLFARRDEQQGRHECHVAVFEPGLSVAQRCLLFDAGIAALHLPLPGPEEQPTSLPGTLLK